MGIGRISGGHAGIKEYLEEGQKSGRELHRDELDQRMVLEGSLDVCDQLIDLIPSSRQTDDKGRVLVEGQERYLHYTFSFYEDQISQATLESVTREVSDFFRAAHGEGELYVYAEAHLPKIKSYLHQGTGQVVERKPHVHMVIPLLNPLTGQRTDPIGQVSRRIKELDALQEHLNHKYGLASPKDHARQHWTGANEIISRWKGDSYKGLKGELLEQVFQRDIRTTQAFTELLSEYGENGLRKSGYFWLKTDPNKKGMNLKEECFRPEFLALSRKEKEAQLNVIDNSNQRKALKKKTPEECAAILKQWREFGSKEVRYINSGNKAFYAKYKAANAAEKQQILNDQARAYHAKHYGRKSGTARNAKWRDERGHVSDRGHSSLASAKDLHSVRTMHQLRNLGDVRGLDAGEKLLPGDASRHVGQQKSRGTERLQSERPGAVKPGTGRKSDSLISEMVRERSEAAAANRGAGSHADIKMNLRAERLLAELSHSHGLQADRYEVVRWKDGSDRIKVGNQNLNVSDFLTKHVHLPWADAAKILEDCYRRQVQQEPKHTVAQSPGKKLWQAFQATGAERKQANNKVWDAQRLSEKTRRSEIKQAFQQARQQLRKADMSPADRQARLSLIRADRALKEQELSQQIKGERLALREKNNWRDEYRSFLQAQAKDGDRQALNELQRMRSHEPDQRPANGLSASDRRTELSVLPVHNRPELKFDVERNGDVVYSRGGHDVIRDEHKVVKVLDTSETELALRLAVLKFGPTLSVSGDEDFKRIVAQTVAQQNMRITFTDESVNSMVNDYREQIERERKAKAEAERAQQSAKRERQPEPRQEPKPEPKPLPKQDTARQENDEAEETRRRRRGGNDLEM